MDVSPRRDDSESTPVSSFVDPVLACPSTLGSLTEGFRSYGGIGLGSMDVRYKTSSKRPGIRVSDSIGQRLGGVGGGREKYPPG